MPEFIQSATAKKLSSEIYFASGTMIRNALKKSLARNNGSFFESTKLEAILHMVVDSAIYDNK